MKYKGETFKIPMIDHWEVVVSKPELIDEVRKAPDDKLSFYAAVDEVGLLTSFFSPSYELA